MRKDLDLILVGGGLASGLIAWRLKRFREHVKFVVLERDSAHAARETWSFHSTDLTPAQLDWMFPLISKSWAGYTTRFPGVERHLDGGRYFAIRSEEFFRKLDIDDHVRFGCEVTSVSDRGVYLRDGTFLTASCVIDARGIAGSTPPASGYRKLVGMDLELEGAHGLRRPILVDASVPQQEGFRFFRVLPWSESRLLIEDTRYSGSPEYSVPDWQREIRGYAAARGWKIRSELRTEHAAIPLPVQPWQNVKDFTAPTIGTRGGFFQMATGDSLPFAVRVAEEVSKARDFSPEAVRAILAGISREHARSRDFTLLLNRMLFCAAEPRERVQIYSRLYGLPEGLVQRFHASRLQPWDYLRILVGRPPISMRRAFHAMREKREEIRPH